MNRLLSVGLQCLLRSEAAADHLWWDSQVADPHLLTFPSPRPSLWDVSLVPTRWWFSHLLPVKYKVNFINSVLFFSLCQGVKDSFLLLLSGFHCFTVLPGVLSFENSKYVFLFIITEDSGPHCSFRFQAANCRVSPYFSLSHFDYIVYSEMQMWRAFFLSVYVFVLTLPHFLGPGLLGRLIKGCGYNVFAVSIVRCHI